jgi:hypothetical protein
MTFNTRESFSIHQIGSLVPESYSREIDEQVSMQEMPYGYTTTPPPADTGDFDQRKLETKNQYTTRRGKQS